MKEREVFVTIDDRVFVIKKLPAARAFAILAEVVTKAAPALLAMFDSMIPSAMANVAPTGGKVTVEEIEAIERRLLSCVYEQKPAGLTAVIDAQGFFGVEDIEYDMALFGQLLIKAVTFNYQDFFTAALAKLGTDEKTNTAI